jgi:hypothetical protein
MYIRSLHGGVHFSREAFMDRRRVRREMDMERVDHRNARYHNLLINFHDYYVGLLSRAFCA